MISVLKKYKKVLVFLLKFFVTYFILFALYSNYLKINQKTDPFKNSPVTLYAAEQSIEVLNWLGYDAKLIHHSQELSVVISLNNSYVGKIVEGCNSISLIILFVAFIIAFSGPLKSTILYLIFGGFFIWFINIFRIVILCILLEKYPAQEPFLHKLLFPAIIYGTIFLLWVLWVNKFSNYKNA